jgi:hypothetical protein
VKCDSALAFGRGRTPLSRMGGGPESCTSTSTRARLAHTVCTTTGSTLRRVRRWTPALFAQDLHDRRPPRNLCAG